MARLKTKWNLKDRQRTDSQTGSVVAVNIWRLACENVLNLENEGFETTTQAQRLDLIAEFCAFAVHVTDRMVHGHITDEARAALVVAVAKRLAELLCDNRADTGVSADPADFIHLLNERSDEYAECAFADTPGFTMRRLLGAHVQTLMGARDNKWIADYVIDAEAPQMHEALKRALATFLKNTNRGH